MSSILVSENNHHVQITLNRPQSLNALNHQMVLEITRLLGLYRDRRDIKAIVFRGAGDRAFCAGGDIKHVYNVGQEWIKGGRQGDNPANGYFRDEYAMNRLLHHYSKPVISLCHGFVMGGGYGIAGNGSHIIVCDNTKFSMPETGIGFFPDVGIGWKLARAGAWGLYIALTGNIFDAEVMMATGLATHKVRPEDLGDVDRLIDLVIEKGDLPQEKTLTGRALQSDHEVLDVFSQDNLKDIFDALGKSGSEFAKATLETLQARCPISLFVTFEHLKRARAQDYDTAIARDERLAQAFFSKPDIYEGIRAAVIDKDRNPRWAHSSIFNILSVDIDYYMQFIDDVSDNDSIKDS